LIYLHVGGMSHTIGKPSIIVIILLQTSPQLEVFTRNYGPPNLQKSKFWKFRDSQLGSPKKKWHLGTCPVAKDKEYYKGEGGGFLQIWAVVSLVSLCLTVHQKCFNYALTNFFFDLCRSMWIIDLLVIHPSPHPVAPTHPSTPKVLRTKKCPPIPSLSIIFTLNSHLHLSRNLGMHYDAFPEFFTSA